MNEDVDDPLFVALIGDIRGSWELEDCHEAQGEIKEVVDSLNEDIPNRSIASRFTVTTRDEPQG